jgi:hypothetical protein
MLRTAIILSIAMSCTAAERWDAVSSTQGSIGFAIASTTSSNVSLGPIDTSWTEATRGEVYFRSYYPIMDGVQPFFEAAIFNDSQNYSNYDGRMDVDTFGLSLSFGGTVMPYQERTGNGPLSIGIMPYVRFAIGNSDVYIRDLQVDDQVVDGSGNVGRLDFGGGADIRVTLGRHMEGAIGGGINFWRSANIDAVVTDQGTLVRISESVDFGGYDVFLKASVGFSF